MAGLFARINSKWPVAGPYAIGISATILVAFIRYLLDPMLGDLYPTVLFLPAVLLAARLGGWRPGLFVLFAGFLVSDYLFFAPRYSLIISGLEPQVRALVFLLVGTAAIALMRTERDVQLRVENAERALRAHHAELELGQERQRAAERQHAAELLRSVLDNALDVIVSVNSKGRIESFNHAGERLFGYAPNEVIGQSIAQLIPDPKVKDVPDALPWYLSAMRGKVNTLERQVVGRRSDGTRLPLEIAFTAFELNNEQHFTGILRDLTERNALEAQLRESQKMEAFGQLAGGVAHDFNNLLTIIIGCTDLLLPSLADDDGNLELLTDIQSAGNRAATLTRQLLAFSRRQLLEPKVVNLNETVTDVEKMLRRIIGEDVILTSILDPHLQQVRVDPGQIEQVLVNLAVNARDAMPRGGQLTIETRNVVWSEEYCRMHLGYMPGRYVMIAMSDTGVGMTLDVKRRMFEPFFTTKGPGQGTGLGLATAFGIVRQSGGQVNVYSEVDVGTSLQVYLPAIDQSPEAEPQRDTVQAMRMGSETILLVEDEEAVRKIAKLALESHGYTVLQAGSGADGLLLLEKNPQTIHLVVSDVVMPGMSGRQFAEAMRRVRPGFRLLYISGYTDDAVVRHGIVAADDAFLQKPFSPNALARKVREVLDKPA